MLAQVEQDVAEVVDLLNRVVVNQRCSHGSSLEAQSQSLHEPGGIQMTISNADVRARHRFGHLCGSHTGKIEAQSRYALSDSLLRADAVDNRAAFVQYAQHLERERLFVLLNVFQGPGDISTA